MLTGMRRWLHGWLFQLREAEPGEVFLHQRRVFVLPSRAGLAFLLLLAILLIGAINYSLSLGFALTFVLAACGVVDIALTYRNLAHLHLAPGRAAPVFAGEKAQFELLLINRSRHDRYRALARLRRRRQRGRRQLAAAGACGRRRRPGQPVGHAVRPDP